MKYNSLKTLTETATLLYAVAILLVDHLWAPALLPLGWIAPAFFVIYEWVFLWLMGRYSKMKPQSVVLASMIIRGVKFLGVAVLMLCWVWLALPEKNALLLYTLGFYLLSSLFEGWLVTAYHKQHPAGGESTPEPKK